MAFRRFVMAFRRFGAPILLVDSTRRFVKSFHRFEVASHRLDSSTQGGYNPTYIALIDTCMH